MIHPLKLLCVFTPLKTLFILGLLKTIIHLEVSQSTQHLLPLTFLPPHQGRRGVDFETEYFRFIPLGALLGDQSRVDLKQDVVEGGAEVGAVDVSVTGGFRVIQIWFGVSCC